MGKHKLTISLLILISALFLEGCDMFSEPFSSTDEVLFCLPEWPFKEPVLSGWEITFYGEQRGSFYCKAEERFFSVKTPKNQILGVTARPVTLGRDLKTETLFFLPAGTVYPHLAKQGSSFLELTWEDGFTASTMKTLEKSGSFNWKHFSDVIETRTREDIYNPWTLNIKQLSETIVCGKFNASSLNQKKPSFVDLSHTDQNTLLFPYVPLNRKGISSNSIPCWLTETSYQNRILTDSDHMMLLKGTDIKKLSDTIVFLPKKYEETVYAKKNSNTECFIDDRTSCKLR